MPTVVRDEYEAGRQGTEPRLIDLPWIQVVQVARDPAVPSALDPGESLAISLAMRVHARAVLLDERLGRRIAAGLGLPVIGTLAVLLRAKQAGLLPAIRPTIDRMVSRGVRLGPAVRDQALRQAGEAT